MSAPEHQDPVAAYVAMLSAVVRDLSGFCMQAMGLAKSEGHMSAVGARVMQLLAEEYERIAGDVCVCGQAHPLPAGFRANIDRLADSTRAKADAAIAADELSGFIATPGGIA